jgi:hypothetical protein
VPELDLAQTNVQLCRQLVAAGWTDDDLRWMRDAYELDMELFSGQFRANGKTQLAHHVGVASALAHTGARPAVVVAGLVHSAYFLGEFGNGRFALNPDKRVRVREAVGPEVETLVHDYTELQWDPHSVGALVDSIAPRSATTRDVVAMRLANEVDEHSDAITRFCPNAGHEGMTGAEGCALFERVAAAFDLDPLGAAVRAAMEQADVTDVPAVLQTTETDSVFTAPASHRRRVHIVLQDSRLGHEVAQRVPGARSLAERVRRVVS